MINIMGYTVTLLHDFYMIRGYPRSLTEQASVNMGCYTLEYRLFSIQLIIYIMFYDVDRGIILYE